MQHCMGEVGWVCQRPMGFFLYEKVITPGYHLNNVEMKKKNPKGSIRTLTNWTKNWSHFLLEIEVGVTFTLVLFDSFSVCLAERVPLWDIYHK